MHIGMFTNAYKPTISGVVRSISLYRRGLIAAGQFVGVFAPEGRNYEDTEPFIFRYPALPLPSELDLTLPVAVSPQINWLTPRLKLDILHSHHPFLIGSEAMSFSRSLRVPLVFTFHSVYHEYTRYLGVDIEIVKQIVRRLVGDYVQKVDLVIVPSHSVLDLLPSYHIDRPVVVAPTPVDMDQFPPRRRPVCSDPNRIQAIYLGRMAKEKNLDFLLRSFARAANQEPRLHLRLVGDGTETEHLADLAEQLGIGDRVEMPGSVLMSQAGAELTQADIFLFTSVTETQGLVVLEAMAAGLPVVAVASPVLSDCARAGENCLLTDQDEEAYASALLNLIAHPEYAEALGRAARVTAAQYSIPVLTQRLLGIYQDTIDAYHRAR